MKIIKLCCALFIITGCTKVQSVPRIDLGIASQQTTINSVNPPMSTGKITVDMSVTPGAKYSVQLTDMKGEVKYSSGFTADNTVVIKQYNYSDIKSGDYYVVLVDIKGTEIKD